MEAYTARMILEKHIIHATVDMLRHSSIMALPIHTRIQPGVLAVCRITGRYFTRVARAGIKLLLAMVFGALQIRLTIIPVTPSILSEQCTGRVMAVQLLTLFQYRVQEARVIFVLQHRLYAAGQIPA
jgi:hypothetical protein